MKYFFDNLEQYGGRTAIIQDDGQICSYREIAEISAEFTSLVKTRSVTMLLCTNCIGSIAGYISFLRNRVVPIMLDAAIDPELLGNLLELYRPKYLWVPAEAAADFSGGSVLLERFGYVLLELYAEAQYEIHPKLGLMLTTSGSTGSPKFVRQSYDNLEANARSICQYLELTENERPITTLPMNYTYGLSVIHSHFMVGAALLVTQYPVVRKEFWDFAKKEKATSLAGVPYTYEMLKKVRFQKMDLPCLTTMTQAGGKLPYELHREFASFALEHNKKFVVMYGQTEATARMSYLPPLHCLDKCGSIGIPIPGGQFSLIDVDGQEIAENDAVGELVYRGANVTLGYAACTADLLLDDEFGGVLITGDMAKRDADGYYYIVGRKKRFLKLYGSRVNLDEIDQLVHEKFPSLDCASTGTDDRLQIYITDEAYLNDVKSFLAEKTHINAGALQTIFIPELPRNEAGKILYNKLGENTDEKK